jgi:hypothetical protein
MNIRNLFLVLQDQLPLSRLIRNVRRGNMKGLFHERAHLTYDGTPKIAYSSKASARKAASKMHQKYGHTYGTYKCVRCPGYHIGKNHSV